MAWIRLTKLRRLKSRSPFDFTVSLVILVSILCLINSVCKSVKFNLADEDKSLEGFKILRGPMIPNDVSNETLDNVVDKNREYQKETHRDFSKGLTEEKPKTGKTEVLKKKQSSDQKPTLNSEVLSKTFRHVKKEHQKDGQNATWKNEAQTNNKTLSNSKLTTDRIDFDGFNNVSGTFELIVPNIVHFIHFEKTELSFVDYIVLRAVLLHQAPDKIFIHTNTPEAPLTGKYWEWVRKDEKLWPLIHVVFLELPDKIFGQDLNDGVRLYHGSDIGRIRLLMKYGGIYLDTDVFVIKNLDKYRKYEFVLNWDEDQSLGTQVLIAHKDARFLKKWLECYREYFPDRWYYNAGEKPTIEVLNHHPELIHRVKGDFGADTGVSSNLYRNSSDLDWHKLDAIHLLSNHRYYMDDNYNKTPIFNESNIINYPCPFGEMAREVMAKLE